MASRLGLRKRIVGALALAAEQDQPGAGRPPGVLCRQAKCRSHAAQVTQHEIASYDVLIPATSATKEVRCND